jgi:hypothetical protein
MPFFGAEMGIESFFYVSRENIAEKKERPGKWPFRAKFDGAYVWGDNRKAGQQTGCPAQRKQDVRGSPVVFSLTICRYSQ